MNLPADNYILLSVLNTALRDGRGTLEELCAEEGWDMAEITARTSAIGYEYSAELNRFCGK